MRSNLSFQRNPLIFAIRKLALASEVSLNITLLAAMTLSAHAQNAPTPESKTNAQSACSALALSDYSKANIALTQAGTEHMTTDAIISQRRLEEQYCLRLTRCFVNEETSLGFVGQFDSCLGNEELEKYSTKTPDH
jgi:hypothetical protein